MKIKNKKSLRIVLLALTYLGLIPAVMIIGIFLFKDRQYTIISILIALIACIPFFVGFERGQGSARELAVIAVMSSIAVVGRLAFAPIPAFKPVTAIVIITGIAFGAEAGFITGAATALISGIFFGQGPWTAFQMFSWGIIGVIAALLFKRGVKKPNKLLLCVIGIIGGLLFSLITDIWATLAIDSFFSFPRYFSILFAGWPFLVIYVVSNIVFLLLLTNPFLEKLNRVRDKFGLFSRRTHTFRIIKKV